MVASGGVRTDGASAPEMAAVWTCTNSFEHLLIHVIFIDFNILPDKLYRSYQFLSFVSIVLYNCSLLLIGRILDKIHIFI